MTIFWLILIITNLFIILFGTIYMVNNIGIKFDIIDPIVKSRLNERFANITDF